MGRLLVRLPRDRDRCGQLSLYDRRGRKICGPFPVAGRASDVLAAANGNVLRNPVLRFGDTPTGAYRVHQIVASGRGTPLDGSQFGTFGVVVLEGIAGDAALAEANGRFHILIVGGKRARDGSLRSTAGSLRLSDDHQKSLVAALRKLEEVDCVVEEEPAPKSRQRVYVDQDCQDQDPQTLYLKLSQTSRSLNRELLLSGAAGAMMSVAFVAFPPSPARAAESPAVASLQTTRDEVKFLPPKSVATPGYTRLAYGGAPSSGAMQQLENAQHQPTGKTFDNSNHPQPSDATPSTPVQVPNNPAPASTGNPQIDKAVQQQQQINAIRSEKPPPNATQEQLNQWQQDQQKRINDVLHPPTQTNSPSN